MSGTREKLGVCFQLGDLQRSLLGASRVESVQEKEESLSYNKYFLQIYLIQIRVSRRWTQSCKTERHNYRLGVSMFLTFQHCQSEMLPGMHQHSPAKKLRQQNKTFSFNMQTNKQYFNMAAFKQPDIPF